jgi:aminopeptidase
LPSQDLLAKYADVAVRIGIGLETGDRLLIRSSVEALDLIRLIVEQAYAAGAVNVDVLWADDATSRARFSHGSAEAAEAVSSGSNFLLRAFELGDQIMSVSAADPDAMAGQDLARIGQFQRINGDLLDPVFTAMGCRDVEVHDHAVYVEPNVWMHHRIESVAALSSDPLAALADR